MYFDEYDIDIDFTDNIDEELGFIGDIGAKIVEALSGVAKEIPAAAGAAIKRHALVQQDSMDTAPIEALKRESLYSKITDRVDNMINPALRQIDRMVDYSDAQVRATNDHHEMLRKDLFRKGVINELKLLADRLPINHPVRTRIERL